MSLKILHSPDDHLPAAQVFARYRVSAMTVHRWLQNAQLQFPRPIRINGRRYWRLGDLEAFEARRADQGRVGHSALPIMGDV